MTNAATIYPGAIRPQSHTEAADYRVEGPFSAAIGLKRFADTRRTQSARSASGAQRRTATAARSAQKRPSGGSSPSPNRRRRKKKTDRRVYFAMGFLLFAIALLVAIILIGSSCTKGCSCKKDSESVGGTPDPGTVVGPETAAPTALPDVAEDFIIERSASIENVSVRNMTVREAKSRVEKALTEKIDSLDITVAYENYDPVLLTGETIGLTYSDEDLQNALKQAAIGTETEISVPLTFDSRMLHEALYVLNDRIPNHAVNAKAEIKFKSKTLDGNTYEQPYWDFTQDVRGATIDFDKLEQEVADAINAGDYMASLTPSVIVSEPDVTLAELKSQITLLSSYQTNYATRGGSNDPAEYDENCRARDWNISKAVGLMQVTVLQPGDSFDFNKKTGKRTEKAGWALANAVYKGGYTPEPGGGVCQVSTTIFNAVLRAGITKITRTGHSIPSDYVTARDKFLDGLGFDATVDYGHIEFRFKNTTDHTIYMFIYITKNNARRRNINVEIYGQKEEGVEYSVYNEILEIIPSNDESKWEIVTDKTLNPGSRVTEREAHDGYRVKTYLVRHANGVEKIIRTEETVYPVIYPKFRVGPATPAP